MNNLWFIGGCLFVCLFQVVFDIFFSPYDIDEDEGYNDFIGMMSKSELKQMIQGIVLDSLDEEDDLNEIIENLTR
jgi:hypothetical protein